MESQKPTTTENPILKSDLALIIASTEPLHLCHKILPKQIFSSNLFQYLPLHSHFSISLTQESHFKDLTVNYFKSSNFTNCNPRLSK